MEKEKKNKSRKMQRATYKRNIQSNKPRLDMTKTTQQVKDDKIKKQKK